MTREGGMKASMEREGGMSVRMGLVCGTSIGKYDFLWVQDPACLATIQGEYLVVKKALQ